MKWNLFRASAERSFGEPLGVEFTFVTMRLDPFIDFGFVEPIFFSEPIAWEG